MILVCIMEKQTIQQNVGVVGLEEGKSYFTSGTYINIISTDVDKLIKTCIVGIEGGIENYQQTGSAWYFKEVEKFILLNIIQQKDHLIFLFQIGYQIKKQ